MHSKHALDHELPWIEEKLNYQFQDRTLLKLAFVHTSYTNEEKYFKENNERLEFLGDAVLQLIVSDFLYYFYRDQPEGVLSTLRSQFVNAQSCARFTKKLCIEEYLLLGKGERKNLGKSRQRLLANLFEAILGAIYLDGGYKKAFDFFHSMFRAEIQNQEFSLNNWKGELQDFCQKTFGTAPIYTLEDAKGPDHRKDFHVSVNVEGKVYGKGSGHSKKLAQQRAAKAALGGLKNEGKGNMDL